MIARHVIIEGFRLVIAVDADDDSLRADIQRLVYSFTLRVFCHDTIAVEYLYRKARDNGDNYEENSMSMRPKTRAVGP